MKYINSFNDYNLYLIKEWFDNQVLTINENENQNNFYKKLSDVWNKLTIKSKNLNKEKKAKLYSYALTILLTMFSLQQIKYMLLNEDPDSIEILKNLNFDEDAIDNTQNIETYFKKSKGIEEIFKCPTDLNVSDKVIKFLKEEEGDPKKKGEPVLKAYKLGDGMITVGWGHAEKIKKSKFKVGQIITREKAEELFQKDLQETTEAVKRIFEQWKKQNINIKLTQDQFDALVSITFNAGIGNIRTSDFIQSIKKNNIKKAGNEILNFKTSGKFPGLKERRKNEAKPFLS
jgi:lysozyme